MSLRGVQKPPEKDDRGGGYTQEDWRRIRAIPTHPLYWRAPATAIEHPPASSVPDAPPISNPSQKITSSTFRSWVMGVLRRLWPMRT